MGKKLTLLVLRLLMNLLLICWISLWIIKPTTLWIQSWRQAEDTFKHTFFGYYGLSFAVFTFPPIALSIIGLIYFSLLPQHHRLTRSGGRSAAITVSRPAIINSFIGIVSCFEIIAVILFLVFLAWTFYVRVNNDLKKLMPLKTMNLDLWQLKYFRVATRFGLLAEACLSLLLFPVLRGLSMFRLLNIQFAASVKYHVWLGTGLIFFSLVHGGSTLFIWSISDHIEEEIWKWQRTGRVYVAGVISLVTGLLMWITSLPQIRRKRFETFYYTHHLYIVFLVSFLFHAGDRHFYWILPGVFLFGLDKTLRIVQSRSESCVLSARLYSCKTVELVLPKDPRLNYAPSSFIFVNIPSISQFQWHPFSITSSSSVDKHTMSVMMKCEGKWTDSVYKKLEEAAISDTKINNITIRVEGPYGPTSSVDFLRYDTLFLVAGGIGITPFLSILQELSCENRLKSPKSVQLVFSVRTFQDINMLVPVSHILFHSIHNLNLKVKVFVTQEKKHSSGPTTLKEYLAQSQVQTIHIGTDEDFSRFQILGHESFRRLATLVILTVLTFLGVLISLSHFFIPNEHKKHSNSMKLAASGELTTGKEKVPSWVPDLVIIVSYVIAMTIGGLAAIILQWRRLHRETLRMTKEEVNPQGRNFTELTPIVPIEEHGIHIGERPKFKEILSEFEMGLRGWSSIGVLVCGPESMKEDVASICRQRFQCFGVDDSRTIHNKVNLNFHSLNFSL